MSHFAQVVATVSSLLTADSEASIAATRLVEESGLVRVGLERGHSLVERSAVRIQPPLQ